MNAVLRKIYQRFDFCLPKPPKEELADDNEFRLLVAASILHFTSLASLSLYQSRSNYNEKVYQSILHFLSEPSLDTSTTFQIELFLHNREIFGQIFNIHFLGQDLLPLYHKKYLQILSDLQTLSRLDREVWAEGNFTICLEEFLKFISNNLTASIVSLIPAASAESPAIKPIGSYVSPKIKGLSPQITPGIYLINENIPPLSLYPFWTADLDYTYIFRLCSSDGIFFQKINSESFNLLFTPSLLFDFAELLTRYGAYNKALSLLRLISKDEFKRESGSLANILSHCINARQASVKKKFSVSAAEMELAINERKDIPMLYHLLAIYYQKASKPASAIVTLNRLLEYFPISEEGYIALGDVYLQKGEAAKALRSYDKAMSYNPYHPEIQKKKLLAEQKAQSAEKHQDEAASDSFISEVLSDISQRIQEQAPLHIVAREDEMAQIIEVLTCRDKHNLLLIGEPGVGKTALVEELALRIQEEAVPSSLQGNRILSVNTANLIAGARFRGQFEERVLSLIKYLKNQTAVLLIENIQNIVATGTTKGSSMDGASLLKPALFKGEVQVIGTSDYDSYTNIIEKDQGFLKYFHTIFIEELPPNQVKLVIKERKGIYESFHHVTLREDTVEGLLELIRQSIVQRVLPESALDLMDRTGARVALEFQTAGRPDNVITREDLLKALAEMSGISYERLYALQRERLSHLEELLSQRVIDQDQAIERVSRVIRSAKMSFKINPHRPDGVFLFVGPTGVGKTELAKALSEVLLGSEEKLIRIDMSEYMERISTSRLIGTSPGYVGYMDQNQLADQVRKNPYAMILFDEIEKADPQVLNLFLQIFDAGRLTDGRGHVVKFDHATIVMTSNIGTEHFFKGRVGYSLEERQRDIIEEGVRKEVKNYFPPEFLNRIDEIVLFKDLSEGSLIKITTLQLKSLITQVENQGKKCYITGGAKSLLAHLGYSFEYGARNLSRVIRREIAEPISVLSLTDEWGGSAGVLIYEEKSRINLKLMSNSDELHEIFYESEEREKGEHD